MSNMYLQGRNRMEMFHVCTNVNAHFQPSAVGSFMLGTLFLQLCIPTHCRVNQQATEWIMMKLN